MSFTEAMDDFAKLFEAIAVLVLLLGLVAAVALAAWTWRRSRDGREAFRMLREAFGGALLLGLEILVAGDLIRTVAVEPSLESVAVLGLIVLIRTFLSFSLEIEIEGMPPWRRATLSGATQLGHVARRAAGRTPAPDPTD